MFLIDAFRGPYHWQLFPDRAGVLGLLSELRYMRDSQGVHALTPCREQILKQLIEFGAFHQGTHCVQENKQGTGSFAIPELLVEFSDGDDISINQFKILLNALSGSVCDSIIIRLQIHSDTCDVTRVAQHIRRIATACRDAEINNRGLIWEVASPACASLAALEPIIAELNGGRLVLQDDSELYNGRTAVFNEGCRFLERCARGGYAGPVEIITGFNESVRDRVGMWLDANDGAGVRIQPLFLDTFRGVRVTPLINESDASRAVEVMLGLTELTVHSLNMSEPWRSILRTAATPGLVRRSWHKNNSSIYFSADAKCARSVAHAEAGLYSNIADLFPSLFSTQQSARVSVTGGGFPACASCSYAALCDKYWTPEQEVLQLLGHHARAQLVASINCHIRMNILQSVLEDWREIARSQGVRSASSARLVYSNREARVTYSQGQ